MPAPARDLSSVPACRSWSSPTPGAASRAAAELIRPTSVERPSRRAAGPCSAWPPARRPRRSTRSLVALPPRRRALVPRRRHLQPRRVLPDQPLDPKSYRAYMHRHLFGHVDIAPNHAHVLDGTVPEAFVGRARRRSSTAGSPPTAASTSSSWASAATATSASTSRASCSVDEALAAADAAGRAPPGHPGRRRPRLRRRGAGHPPRPDHGRGADPGRAVDPDAGHRAAQGRGRRRAP